MDNSNDAEYIKGELLNIKSELISSKEENINKTKLNDDIVGLLNSDNMVNQGLVFDEDKNQMRDTIEPQKDVVLLGQLLKFLREKKEYSCLMACRKINKLILKDNLVEIDIDESYFEDIINNEKNNSLITQFFKSNNLDFKIKGKMIVKTEIDKLNDWFGGKLIIKYAKNV